MSKKISVLKSTSKKIEKLISPNASLAHDKVGNKPIETNQKSHLSQTAKTNKNIFKLTSLSLQKSDSSSNINLSSRQSNSKSNYMGYLTNWSNKKSTKPSKTDKSENIKKKINSDHYEIHNGKVNIVNTNQSSEKIMFDYDDNSEVKINVDVDDTTSHITILKNEEKNIFNFITYNSDSSYSSDFLNYKLGNMQSENQSLYKDDNDQELNFSQSFKKKYNDNYNGKKNKNDNIKDKEKKIQKMTPLLYEDVSSSRISQLSTKNKNTNTQNMPVKGSSSGISSTKLRNIKTEPVKIQTSNELLHKSITQLDVSHITINKPRQNSYKFKPVRSENVLCEIPEADISCTSYFRNTDEDFNQSGRTSINNVYETQIKENYINSVKDHLTLENMINIYYSENLINYTSGMNEEDKYFLNLLEEHSKITDFDAKRIKSKEIYFILLKKFLIEKDNYETLTVESNTRLTELKQECISDYIKKNKSMLNSLKNKIYRLQDDIEKLNKDFIIRRKNFLEITTRLKELIENEELGGNTKAEHKEHKEINKDNYNNNDKSI